MPEPLIDTSRPFLAYLENWQASLPEVKLSELIKNPANTAILSVDMTNGFCYQGPLASPRVRNLIPSVVDIFSRAWQMGVRHILLPQDTHDPAAVEFSQYPPHCIRGTAEAEAVPEIKVLPFYDQMQVFEKNSINSFMGTQLGSWFQGHPEVDTFIVVGDCTDLCVYQLAMDLSLDANARQKERRVIVPANAVDTYDLPVDAARQVGAFPHDADLLHVLFLYHMALNGVEVYSKIT